MDYANSLDKIGPIGKCVHDVALGLSLIAGHDKMDSTSLTEKPKDYTTHLNRTDLKGMKIGVPKEYFQNVDTHVSKQVWLMIDKAEGLGASINEFSLPMTKVSLAAYYIIATAEASTNLAKYCGMRYGMHKQLDGNFNEYFSSVRTDGFGEEAKRRIMLGTFGRMSGYRDAYYIRAMRVRTLIIQDFKKAFAKFDVLMAPTMPISAPKFTEIKKMTPLQNYQMDVLTVPANFAGIPHLSMPTASGTNTIARSKDVERGNLLYNKNNMPIGLHILGDHLKESNIIEVASVLEGE